MSGRIMRTNADTTKPKDAIMSFDASPEGLSLSPPYCDERSLTMAFPYGIDFSHILQRSKEGLAERKGAESSPDEMTFQFSNRIERCVPVERTFVLPVQILFS